MPRPPYLHALIDGECQLGLLCSVEEPSPPCTSDGDARAHLSHIVRTK